MSDQLRITEIFNSLQGESKTMGLPTVFVRLTGCPLRCRYCDSTYAFFGGERMTIAQILDKVASYSPRFVCVTGGEPLAQPLSQELLSALADMNYQVSLETSGALSLSGVDPRICKVMDIKTPDSGESHRNCYHNIKILCGTDQVKFVICSRSDYDWACLKLDELGLYDRVGEILFSPSYDDLNPQDLANWIVKDNLKVRFQLQMHKILWGDQPGY